MAGQLASMLLIAVLVIWSSYGFSTATVNASRLQLFSPTDPRNVAARYAAVSGYEWVRPDVMVRYWAYGRDAERQGFHGIDFVDWAKAAGYPSPLAGRGGDTMRGAPPVAPLRVVDSLLEPLRAAEAWFDARVPIPAPQFIAGLVVVKRHAQIGHPTYFLGQYGEHGWWYYFPVLLFFKTPLPFTLLAAAGIILLSRRGILDRDAEALSIAIAPLVMLVPAMASGINIGLRHVLPVYPLLTVAAAYAAGAAWRSTRRLLRPLVVALLAWMFIGTGVAHPDYLAWFNELARDPARIAVDSNLDWGQDLLRLESTTRRRHIDRLHLAYFGSAVWTDSATRVEPLEPNVCTTGWLAVSETILKQGGPDHRGAGFRWLGRFRSEQVGRSIRLYHVPGDACRE